MFYGCYFFCEQMSIAHGLTAKEVFFCLLSKMILYGPIFIKLIKPVQ